VPERRRLTDTEKTGLSLKPDCLPNIASNYTHLRSVPSKTCRQGVPVPATLRDKYPGRTSHSSLERDLALP
jgi:hypothetical protein